MFCGSVDIMQSVQQQLLRILANGRFHSGSQLGEQLGLTRAAIWKHIQHLRKLGLDVHAVRGRGYRLPDTLCLLDQQAIHSALQKKTRKRVALLEVFASLPSTSTYLKDQRVRSGQVAVCFAETQTSGRGRRGRNWVSPFAANIYVSIKQQLLLDEGVYGTLSLLMGVAMCRVLKEVGVENASLKWPNDIYFNQAKLAGVLVEYAGEVNGPVSTVIGMGMNIKMPAAASKNIDQDWTDLDSIIPGIASRRNQLCASLVDHVLLVLEECESGHLAGLLDEWRQYDMLYGHDVVLQLPNRKISGRARGINMRGQLLIEQAEGKLVAYASGELSVRVKR